MTDPDVLALQKCLNYDPATTLKSVPGQAGSSGHETSYFGFLTVDAVDRFQAKYGIAQVGQIGPVTRLELNKLFSGKLALVDAVIQVESGGNDNAQGDLTLPAHAYGALQIRQGVVDQVNIKLGTQHKSQECLGNRALSLLIWNTYWTIFIDMVSNEDKTKCWNGGVGWKALYGKVGYETYTATLDAYWKKVSSYM
jgi:murein L,D-transpeptidase YcbB/YkuD